MKKRNTDIWLSIAFVVMIFVCSGLSSRFIGGESTSNILNDLMLMFGNVLIMIVAISLITVVVIIIYRKK